MKKPKLKPTKPIYSFDTKKDKKLRLYISAASVLTAIIMFVIGCFIVPIKELYDAESFGAFAWRALAVVLSMAACLAAHEGIHILLLKKFHGSSADAGFDEMYPRIGSKDTFERQNYVLISLAPVIILFAVLLVTLLLVSEAWFWVVYITLIMHISGSVGDIFCAYKIITEKEEIRISDDGKTVELLKK